MERSIFFSSPWLPFAVGTRDSSTAVPAVHTSMERSIFSSSPWLPFAVVTRDSSTVEAPTPQYTEFTAQDIDQFTNSLATRVGGGGFGDIYLGHIGDQAIAVKVSNMLTRREEWQKEIQFSQMFDNPNVIKLLGAGEDAARFFLVYPYYPMGSLQDHMADLKWPEVIKVLRGIAAGLEHIHKKAPPIIHCDLKPANILLDTDYNPIICDFGSARHEGEVLESYTFGYQSSIRAAVDPRSDIFSLGVIILQLMSKQNSPIIEGENISTRIAKAHDKSREVHRRLRRSGCQREEGRKIINLGLTCAAVLPTSRPSTVEEVLQHLNYPPSSRAEKFLDKLRYMITRS